MMETDWIVGVGSPQGDDAVGWLAVERLVGQVPDHVRSTAVGDPTELLLHMAGCRRLWIIDACRSGQRPGSISRLSWPDERLIAGRRSSTHAMSLADALRLAEALGTLPSSVVIYAVEVTAATRPGDEMSPPVAAAVVEIEQILLAELAAPHVSGQSPTADEKADGCMKPR